MAILRSLLVTLGLSSGQYRTDLNKTVRDSKKGFSEMTADAAKFGVAVLGGVATVSAMTVAMSKMARQQSNSADLAGMTVTQYKAMTIAAQQFEVGVDLIQQSIKDASERVGEFLTDGKGGFNDFVTVMKLSSKEAANWAKEMEEASGAAILGRMVSEMDAAGVSSKKMSFALEGVATESTLLIPLYRDTAKGLLAITKQATSALISLELKPEELANYKTLALNVDILGQSVTSAGQKILSHLAEPLSIAAAELSNFLAISVGGDQLLEFDQMIKVQGAAVKNLGDEYKRIQGEVDANGDGFIFNQERADAAKERYDSSLKTLQSYNAKREALIKESNDSISKLGGAGGRKYTLGDTPIGKDTPASFDGGGKSKELLTIKELDDMIIEQALWRNGQLEIANQERVKNDKEANKKLQEEADSLVQLQYDQTTTMLGGIQSGFSQVAALAEEGSGLQKVMFIASQAAAAANVMVSAEQAKWMARSTIPSLVGQEIAARTIDMNKYISLGSIAAQTVAGVFHGGGAVPKNNGEQTYLLKGGEYVESEAERRKIDSMVSGGGAGGSGGNTVQVIVQGNIYGDAETKRIINTAAKQGYTLVAQDFRGNGTISRTTKR